jgi:MFS family permease
VMAIRVGVALGGTSMGAPIVGWVANHFGPRWSLGIGAVSAFLAALVAALMMTKPVAAPLNARYIRDACSWQKHEISTSLNGSDPLYAARS